MKQKRVLNLGMMLACGLAANAGTPIFHEGFNAEQTKQPTDVAWYEFINTVEGDERNIDKADAFAGDGCLNFFNAPTDANWWMRAVKFRNLPLEAGKSYRLKFRFKGDNTWNIDGATDNKGKMKVALMQGGEDADIALLDANKNEFMYEISYFNPDNYEKYTRMFYFADADLQKSVFAERNPDKEPLADTFFATFNVYNPGNYYLDEVELVESSIAGVAYAGDVIRVDFGYGTNIKDMVNASDLKRVIMPKDCVSLKIAGADAEVESVELQSDGYMYIFLPEPLETEDADIEVAFQNPTDEAYQIKYNGTLAPEGAVFNFEGEKAEFQQGLEEITSWAYTDPLMTSSLPVDGSFGLDETTSEVSLTFDKPVLTTDDAGNPLVAKLNGNEDLVLKTEAPGDDQGVTTLTFGRKDNKPFEKGSYTVTVEGITSDKYIRSYETFTVNFETGKITIAKETLTPIDTINFDAFPANSIPEGWTLNNEGEIRPGGSQQGSGPRLFSFPNGNPAKSALYMRCALNEEGVSKGGDVVSDEPITLPAGDLRLQFFGCCWKGSGLKVDAEILDETGTTVIAHTEGIFETNVNGDANKQVDFDRITVPFKNPAEGKYKIRLTMLPAGQSWSEIMFGGVLSFSYSKTEGESTEAEIAFEDKVFGGPNALACGDNCAPKEGSGWELFQDGIGKKNPGQDYNYSGQRVFALGTKNLATGYYTNGGWPNSYMIYGNGEEGSAEPTLHLKSGRHQITYYTANWKENGSNAGKDHIVYFELAKKADASLVYERQDKITGCDLNGDRNAAVTAKMVQFTVNIPEEGDYTLKVGGTTEQFIGNFKIEKLGSQSAYYLGLVNTARQLAVEELKNSENAMYDGTTKSALQAAVDKYEDPTFMHTAQEINAAKAELEGLTNDMVKRREYVSRYDAAKVAAKAILDEVGEKPAEGEDPGHEATKFAKLEAFVNLDKVYNEIAAKTAQEQEDKDLIENTTSLENNTTWLKNMKDKAVGLLTKQIVDAAALIVKYDASLSSDNDVIAAGNALTDDQGLAKMLKLRLTKAIYEQCAAGDPFNVLDRETLESEADSINLDCYIQNANLYTLETAANRTLTDVKNLPGWNIDAIKGTPGIALGWSSWTASDINPVNDQFLICGWNTEWNLYQTVTNLPVGQYRYVSGTQDRGFGDKCDDKIAALETQNHWTVAGNVDGTTGVEGEIFSYIWWQVGEQRDSVHYDITNQGQWYDFTECNSKPILVPAIGDTNMGEITIGSYAKAFQSQAAADNFRLYMTGKAEGFDYANAAKKLAEEIETDVQKVVMPEGEPVKVTYYDLNGQATTTPQGVTLKVYTYKNGAIKVVKTLVK